jgi:hypothetical protein
LQLNVFLKTADEIDEAVENFNKTIQKAAWKSTPEERNIKKDTEYQD